MLSIGIQLAMLAGNVYSFVVSWVLLKGMNAVMGLRLADDAEVGGLDVSEHSETAYNECLSGNFIFRPTGFGGQGSGASKNIKVSNG